MRFGESLLGQLETCWGAIAIVTVEIVLLADVVGM